MDLEQSEWRSDVPINAWRYRYGPYWIVLLSSVCRERLPLLIDTVLKVWSGSWQQLRESTRQQTNNSFNALSGKTSVFRTFEFLSDDIDLVGGSLMVILAKYAIQQI